MIRSIGLIEFLSIAKGIESTDAMLKAANVKLVLAKTTCPGKYISLVTGDVGAVKSSVETGKLVGGAFVIDSLLIPNIHQDLLPAISGTTAISGVNAIGVIESYSIASIIVAADAAAKSAKVNLIEVRLGMGIGGKSYVTLTGNVSDVEDAVRNGSQIVINNGYLVNKVVIPSPDKELFNSLL